MIIETYSPVQTRVLGRRLGGVLRGLDVICLYGNLGSGKTTLTQGLARGAGFRGRVVSPTFNLMRVYKAGKRRIFHIDLYRVSVDETGDIGLEDALSDPEGICIIEWPEAGDGFYPSDRLELRLSHAEGGQARRIVLSGHGPRSRDILRRIKD
ncbi:MAG: tRNA (adenosine(37)-N6)-threonylcarbamoyltransferase complex ATPase subunit type 1 TsaE [Elusimicrobia bacterium RIFCSPHIGHO2_02_FULL_57_9]|nr:MAG: tRNA (adenosine(37)-N6)-threonylcarbamoyltransferase complex ATPase subunit type 1 TsaE [Elusimicrobia bacterium RIFCSPHIGHO2_02_FULL_57_9]